MPPPFQDLDLQAQPPDFVRLLARFPFERRITEIHVHHVWLPRGASWRGHQTLQTIWYTQTRQLGLSDIAQHVSVGPGGCLWTGRDWNRPPCSAPGRNGTRAAGPFMITLIGEADHSDAGVEPARFDPLVDTIARVQLFAGVTDRARLLLDDELEPPVALFGGYSTVDRAALVAAVDARRVELQAAAGAPASSSRSTAAGGTPPFGEDAEAWYQFITVCNAYRGRLRDEPPGSSQRAPSPPAPAPSPVAPRDLQ